MAKAMGLNAISTYVFWNVHEEERGRYRFDGDADVGAFMRIAHEEGLRVLLRPGPYVCAEWDFGGLPAWLLCTQARLRTTDPAYLQPVREWMQRLGAELAPLHARNGGPIAAVQIENEYGAFGDDTEYLHAMREVLRESGFGDLPMYTIDQPGDLHRGMIDGVCAGVTFAPGDAGSQFTRLRQLRQRQPLLCGEFWAGWFDHWGEPHALLDDALQVLDLQWMLREGVSFNVYMFHGGTNFALWNGANVFAPHRYQPTVTSYDYQAALDERGAPTAKYVAFRDAIAAHTGVTPPQPPELRPCVSIAPFALHEWLPIDAALGEPVESRAPLSMEELGGSRGYIVYRTRAAGDLEGVLEADIRDYAIVSVDGEPVAILDRRYEPAAIDVRAAKGACIEVVVENGGRINYGEYFPGERKGVIGAVCIGAQTLNGWKQWIVSARAPLLRATPSEPGRGPGFFRGSMHVDTAGDTFLDVRSLRKGAVWINGHCAGRVWEDGPQRDLYIPGCWLQPGANEVIALELQPVRGMPVLSGATGRLWSEQI